MRDLAFIGLIGLITTVCNSPTSDGASPGSSAQAVEPPSEPSVSPDSAPQWDRPMPFVDEGWLCKITCVWSEEAAEKARLMMWPDDPRRPTAFCFGGVFNDEPIEFSPCSERLDICQARRRIGYPDSEGSTPCKEMTPTEFWRENPKLVEVHRKICKPQECPQGYRWLGAAKIKGESLAIDETSITDLGDGIMYVDPPEPDAAGFLLGEDDECTYGCLLQDCGRSQYGCVDTTFATCDVCFDEDPIPHGECRRVVQGCREVEPLVRAAFDTCVFADVTGDETEERFGCIRGYTCRRLYDESYPRGFRLRGICERVTSD